MLTLPADVRPDQLITACAGLPDVEVLWVSFYPENWGLHADLDVLDAMAEIAPAEEWRKHRLRFEHGDGLRGDLLERAREYGVIVVQNPSHFAFAPNASRAPPGLFLLAATVSTAASVACCR